MLATAVQVATVAVAAVAVAAAAPAVAVVTEVVVRAVLVVVMAVVVEGRMVLVVHLMVPLPLCSLHTNHHHHHHRHHNHSSNSSSNNNNNKTRYQPLSTLNWNTCRKRGKRTCISVSNLWDIWCKLTTQWWWSINCTIAIVLIMPAPSVNYWQRYSDDQSTV